jgi:hypothetical protein
LSLCYYFKMCVTFCFGVRSAWRNTVVALLLHCWYTVIALLLHCCYTVVTFCLGVRSAWRNTATSESRILLLLCYYTVLTLLSHCCHTAVIIRCVSPSAWVCSRHGGVLLLHYCYTVVTLFLHCSYTALTRFLNCHYHHMCVTFCLGVRSAWRNTAVTLFLHCFHTAVTLLFPCCYTCCYTLVTLLLSPSAWVSGRHDGTQRPARAGCCHSPGRKTHLILCQHIQILKNQSSQRVKSLGFRQKDVEVEVLAKEVKIVEIKV